MAAPDPSAYWRSNLRLVTVLLVLWFAVSLGAGVLWVDPLNEVRWGGFRLGFWFAQQGSIYVFVVLIAIYAVCMRRLDRRHGVGDDEPAAQDKTAHPDPRGDDETSGARS